MGRNFRGSEYLRSTWLSKRTVKDGEAMVMWSLGGKAREIVGPARVRTKFSTIRFLDRATAGAFEYLRIERRDGVVEHVQGPKSIWVNPVKHGGVTVEPATHLSSTTEAVVVYRVSSDKTARSVVRGPCVYTPQFGERLHEFEWNNKKFTTIRVGTPQTLALEASIFSNDSGSATVTLGLSIVVDDVEKLLDSTSDLPHDLATSLESDLLVLGRKLDSQSLRNLRGLARLVEGLEDDQPLLVEPAPSCSDDVAAVATSAPFRSALPRLCARCDGAGVALCAVELRGLQPSSELSARWRAADHDAKSIENAAQAKRDADRKRRDAHADSENAAALATAKFNQDVLAARRAAELEKVVDEQKKAKLDRDHAHALEDIQRQLQVDEAQAQLRAKQAQRVEARFRDAAQAELDKAKLQHDEIARFLAELKTKADVDVNTLLKAAKCDTKHPSGIDALAAALANLARPSSSFPVDDKP